MATFCTYGLQLSGFSPTFVSTTLSNQNQFVKMGQAGFILQRPFTCVERSGDIPGLKSQGFQGISYNLNCQKLCSSIGINITHSQDTAVPKACQLKVKPIHRLLFDY